MLSPMRLRPVLTAFALVLGVLFAPGIGVLGGGATQAHAVTKLTHAEATARFSSSGITWSSSGGCSNRNVATCTSFDQLNLATAQGAQTLKSATGCALNITGGTETGTPAARTPTGTATSSTSPSRPASPTTSTTSSPTSACAVTVPPSTRRVPATSTPTRATTGT